LVLLILLALLILLLLISCPGKGGIPIIFPMSQLTCALLLRRTSGALLLTPGCTVTPAATGRAYSLPGWHILADLLAAGPTTPCLGNPASPVPAYYINKGRPAYLHIHRHTSPSIPAMPVYLNTGRDMPYMPVWPILLYSDQTQLWSTITKSTLFLISF
jgi:hypothetical protein